MNEFATQFKCPICDAKLVGRFDVYKDMKYHIRCPNQLCVITAGIEGIVDATHRGNEQRAYDKFIEKLNLQDNAKAER